MIDIRAKAPTTVWGIRWYGPSESGIGVVQAARGLGEHPRFDKRSHRHGGTRQDVDPWLCVPLITQVAEQAAPTLDRGLAINEQVTTREHHGCHRDEREDFATMHGYFLPSGILMMSSYFWAILAAGLFSLPTASLRASLSMS